MPRRSATEDPKFETKRKESVPSISYFTLYRFATKWDKLLIILSLLASFISAIVVPFAITFMADVFQNMITYDKSVQAGTPNTQVFLNRVHVFGIKYTCVGVVLFIAGYLGSTLINITALNQVYRIRREYLIAALNQDFAYFDLCQTGDFASKMADDVIKLENGIGDKISTFIHSLTIALGCVLMALVKGWKLTLLCLITTPLSFLLVGLAGKIANRLSKKEAAESGQAASVAQEVLSSIRTVYAFNGQQKEIERYRKPLAEVRRISIKKEFFTGLSMGFLFFSMCCSYALSFFFGVYLVIHDPIHYNADVMFSVLIGIMTALGNFSLAGSLITSFGSAQGAGAQIFRLLDNMPTINPLLDRGVKPQTFEGNIELKDVVFRYPSRPDVPVLNGVSLTVKRGQSLALVGHSGCGKSTIIHLISRYYDVISGNVCVDGHDVRELGVRWLRAKIGLVGQEPVLFNTTVRENIRYGKEESTEEEIEAAAKQAYAHNFIIKLPKGYDTLVGERGASLSGGQKQRIAIARALVRNPRLLLLDEATSALDTASEAAVQKALEKAAKGRTTVVVAHRLSTIRRVDVIHLLKNGEIVESGTHEQLVAARKQYYNLFTAQETVETGEQSDTAAYREETNTLDEDIDDIPQTNVLENEKVSEETKLSFGRVVALNAHEWKWLTFGGLVALITGFSMPSIVVLFGDLYESLSLPDPDLMMDTVKRVSVLTIIIGVVLAVSNLFEWLSFGIASAYMTERLRLRMFTKMLQQHVAYFDEKANSTGALCARLSAEAAYVQGATGQRIGIILQGIGSIGLAFVLAMILEYRVGLVVLAFLPLFIIVVYYQGKTTRDESWANVETLEDSTKIAIEAVSNMRTVASIGRQGQFAREYARRLRAGALAERRAAHARGLCAALSHSMFIFINAAALTYGAHLIVYDNVQYENIFVTTQSLQMASTQVQNAFTFAPDFQKGINAASRIVKLLNMKTEILDPGTPAVSPFKSKGEASFEKVVFHYPCRPGVRVLRGLDLEIESGQTLAVVGRSGCGKSTVIQLLQRYYEPDAGSVCLDGIPLPELRVSEVRECLGLVAQEPVLFDRTIAENIAYGDNSREIALQEIIDVAKQVNMHDFIVTLPQGYDTNIGSKGMQLSGGQKQRVAIARALVRRPTILLLDEATSALDTESEKAVQAALEAAAAGRTCVLIAHRLSTVRDAARICVLSAGRVAEAGTHQQLINLKGLYYNLHATGK